MTSSSKFSRRSFFKTGIGGALASIIPLEYGYAKKYTLDSITTPTGFDDNSLRKVRSQFILKRGVTYMNNASLGMPPAAVVNAVRDGYKAISEEPLHGKHDLQNMIANKVIPG